MSAVKKIYDLQQDVSVRSVLNGAKNGLFNGSECVVIGIDAAGELYLASTHAKAVDTQILLSRAQNELDSLLKNA